MDPGKFLNSSNNIIVRIIIPKRFSSIIEQFSYIDKRMETTYT